MPSVRSDAAAYIGKLLVDARQSRGLTQDQVAAATGIDSANIRKYENGRAMPSIQILVRLAQGLDVEPGSLLTGITLELFPVTEEDRRRRGA